MALTQKYKQTQQQVRVHTNESNYLKGMYFTDVPLAEGYSRVLINFDIDSLSGKISPRKGLQTLGVVRPNLDARQYLINNNGFNIINQSKVCYTSDIKDKRKINKTLQSVLYNTKTRSLSLAVCEPEISEDNKFDIIPFTLNSNAEFVTPEPFIIAQPEIHNKECIHNNFFKRPVGTFAFGNSYYTFLVHSRFTVKKIADLPNEIYPGIESYNDLTSSTDYIIGETGKYFKFISGVSNGIIAYYDKNNLLQIWTDTEEELQRTVFPDDEETNILCYTKLGMNIQDDEVLLNPTENIEPDKYYICVAQPNKLNPTEAASWGYNMLLEDPYNFECEKTAVNMVTILGMLPYDDEDKIILTPKKNQQITLKGYYRAPETYHSDAQNARFYATTKKKITVTVEQTVYETHTDLNGETTYRDAAGHIIYYGYTTNSTIKQYYYKNGTTAVIISPDKLLTTTAQVTEERDPKTVEELRTIVTDLTDYKFGDWWYCSEEPIYEDDDAEVKVQIGTGKYYMVMPDGDLTKKKIDLFGISKPAASEKLAGLPEKEENTLRIRWQMRQSGASDWITIGDDTPIKLSDYYAAHGDFAPFTVTTTLPDSEVIIKLTISDPNDPVEGLDEEYILSTNTIGISSVSDELSNTLNLTPKNFDLGRCTGICEWEQRLVVWGVPDALNTLFISDVNNPFFFPYPNNIDTFTDPIIAVHNYGNELLVLTTTSLYRLIWDTEGTGWTHKLVQQNFHIKEEDTFISCVIKNMFFFKSGEHYYMMVPKVTAASSIRGEVTIAPISKPIDKLLDNFHEEVYNLIKVIVDRPNLSDFTNRLVNYFSYVDNTKVVVNYVYDLNEETTNETNTESIPDSKYLYVQLIYDTDIRTWTMRVFEAAHMLYASHIDTLQQDRFIDITPALNGDQLVIQYYKFTDESDFAWQYIDKDSNYVMASRLIKNYQYLDTGNREINTEMKKRFREFQFKIKNNNLTNLGFFTSFLIDGSLRKDLQRYQPRFLLDEITGEATFVVERVLDAATMTYKTTRIERVLVPARMLQDEGELTPTTLGEEEDPDHWVLNQSAFPGRTLCKIRMPISGKGLTPRTILLSTNEQYFEILGHSWVYRTMHGR